MIEIKYRLLGVIGLLSLILPWEIGFWESGQGTIVAWHLLRLGWFDSISIVEPVFTNFSAEILTLSFIAIFGFFSAIIGCMMLIQNMWEGGILLITSVVLWLFYLAVEFNRVTPYTIIPVGAAIALLVGMASLLK
jgi:hypothetical protein